MGFSRLMSENLHLKKYHPERHMVRFGNPEKIREYIGDVSE